MRGSVHHKKVGGNEVVICEIQIMYNNLENLELSVELPLEDEKFVSLQEQDPKIWELRDKVKDGMYNEFYLVKNNVLFRSIVDNSHKFEDSLVFRLTGMCHTPFWTQPVWTQWIPEDIHSHQASVLLQRYEGASFVILQKLQGLCTAKGSENPI